MAVRDLSIELASGSTVHPGETVEGHVVFTTDGGIRCDGLDLAFGWETSGKGISTRRTLVEETLFSGELADPGPRRFPFRVEVPDDGPFSYRGEYLEVTWFLRATADIPWAWDPKAEERIEVVVPPAPREADAMAPPAEIPLELPERPPGLWAPVIGGIASVASLVAGGGGLAFGLIEGEMGAAIGGGVFALVGLFVAFQIVRPAISGRRLGATRISIEPDRVRPGRSFHCDVAMIPPRGVRLEEITAEITARERVIRRKRLMGQSSVSGPRRVRTRRVYDEKVLLSGPQTIGAGAPFRAGVELSVPPDAPPTFHSAYNHLEWHVVVKVRVPWWPDLVSLREVEVGL